MTTGLRFFYRHIHVTGLENIPSKGPAIIIANHNSSLMDAALLGILLKRRAYFFARGDVFVNKGIRKILWWLHMMPVHSYEGGRNTLSVNKNSFSDGQQILLKGGIIVFFPESTSHIEHQLLPFRKGVFRIAFETAVASNFSFEIPIVPVGITYDHPTDCRADVQVHAGRPLLLSDYKKEYHNNTAAALLHICKDAHRCVQKLVLHTKNKDRLQTFEHYLITGRNDNPSNSSKWKIQSSKKLVMEQDICEAFNSISGYEFENKKLLAGDYFKKLSGATITDNTIIKKTFPGVWNKVRLVLGFPFYITGLLLNGLPVLAARKITNKKVWRKDFYSWIFVACYSVMYFLWLLLLLTTIAFLFGWQYSIVVLIAMIITGIFAYVYKDWLKDNSQQNKWNRLPATEKASITGIRKLLSQDLKTNAIVSLS